MKKVKLLHMVFLIVSFLFGLYGIYLFLNDGDSIQIICFIIGGIILGYNDWKIFLTKNK
jgi:lipid-A-disaccharide synthase-like uncharacterized protein